MAIRNVISTLPDKEYIAALERELFELRQIVERLAQNERNQSRGR